VARPKKHWPMVEASRDEASLAVRLYNDATDIRSFEGVVVHLHLAWLYLLHSEFTLVRPSTAVVTNKDRSLRPTKRACC
jgi:hypothetical protein